MSNTSLAAQAVANSTSPIAPAAFNGIEWLVALNVWAFTAACLIGAMTILTLLSDWWRHRERERPRQALLARIWRVIGLMFATGITLRCGAGALVLWGWNIDDPGRTGALLFIQRVVDPVAIAMGVTGMTLFVLTLPGMLHQLRRDPLPLNLWQAWPVVRRMLAVGVICFVAAVGVTVTR